LKLSLGCRGSRVSFVVSPLLGKLHGCLTGTKVNGLEDILVAIEIISEKGWVKME